MICGTPADSVVPSASCMSWSASCAGLLAVATGESLSLGGSICIGCASCLYSEIPFVAECSECCALDGAAAS